MAVAAHLSLVAAHALHAPRLPPDSQANVFFGTDAIADVVREQFPLIRRLRREHHAATREGDRGKLRPHGTTPPVPLHPHPPLRYRRAAISLLSPSSRQPNCTGHSAN